MASVLITDDEENIRRTLTRFLREAGHQVEAVADAAEAQGRLQAQAFDIVVTDLVMPPTSGVELLQWVRRECPDTFVLLMTGEPTVDTAAAAVRAGAYDYLVKPFSRDLIVQAVGRAAQAREWREEKRRLEAANRDYQTNLERMVEERTRMWRVSQALYHSLVEHLPQAIFRKDIDGRFTFANQRFCQSVGKSLEELVGQTDFDLFPPDLAAKYRQDDRHVLTTGQSLDLVEDHHRPGQDPRFMHVVKTPLRDAAGDVVGVQGIFWDVTDRKRTEDQLRKLARAVEQSPASIIITDRDGNIEFVNPKFTQITGYRLDEVLGRNPRLLKSGEAPPEVYRRLWAAITRGEEWHGEFHNRRKDGTLFWETASISPIYDSTGAITHFVAVKEDTTERKQLESQFLRAQRLEALGALASGIAHDLNNILAPILMTASLLRESALPAENRAMLGTIESCAQRGADIIRQLLTFARGHPGARVPLPVHHLLRELETIVRETFPRDIRPTLVAPGDVWPVLGDSTQVHQCLLNLCINARDAMPDGGTLTLAARNVTLDEAAATLTPGAQPGDYVCVTVADTGEGIPPEHLDHIFDPFFTTKENGQGTGLGLATVLGIVRGHGGYVRVTSRLRQGTSFELYFPASPHAPAASAAAASHPAPRGHGELILVVDDEVAVRESLRRTLEGQGYQVLTASHGAEALTAFTRQSAAVRAVLTDLMMPVMNGPALVQALRELNPGLPVLGMTGLPDRPGADDLEGFALSAVLTKPFPGEELQRELRHVLEGAGRPAAAQALA
ncbi:MAG: PAS domain S-box protein [Verrucomicrobiales bacterium]|nr:PAS domain S-box protein [Verrucomicrobiales bacterium]